MSLKIIPTPTFEKELKKLAKKYPSMKEDYTKMLEFLVENPQSKEHSIGNGLYKSRLKVGSLKKGEIWRGQGDYGCIGRKNGRRAQGISSPNL